MTETVFSSLFQSLETAILIQQDDGSFQLIGQEPDWFVNFFSLSEGKKSGISIAETFPFLGNFLIDAEHHWQHQAEGILDAGLWIEINPQGEELPLQASAICLKNDCLLLIQHPPLSYYQRENILQTGREKALEVIEVKKQAADHLRRSTFYDWLTGLPNQALLELQLTQHLTGQKAFPLCLLDIDQFKVINLHYGRTLGDQLLLKVVARIKLYLAPGDLFARLDGDDFIVIPWALEGRKAIESFVERLLLELALPYQLENHKVLLKFYCGITLDAAGVSQPKVAINQAFIAMENARGSEQQYALYEPQMHLQMLRHWHLERDLPQAIQKEQLRVFYQSIVSLKHKKLAGFEALVRWLHPTYGLLSPYEFIPLAEKTGFIVPIGQWIMHQACAQVAQWNGQIEHPITVQVNLSAQELLQTGLPETIQAILQQACIPPKALKLEITESMVIHNLDLAVKQLRRIKATGVHISMDDFGTGYSSLSYLHQLPIDSLKIDRSLTQAKTTGSTKVLKAIISLAHNLEMDVTAEGVENNEQLERIQNLGCDHVQGYLFSKPQLPDLAQNLLN